MPLPLYKAIHNYIHHQNETKIETWDAVIKVFDYLANFYFIYIYFLLHVEELSFCFQFFSFNCNFDFFYHC